MIDPKTITEWKRLTESTCLGAGDDRDRWMRSGGIAGPPKWDGYRVTTRGGAVVAHAHGSAEAEFITAAREAVPTLLAEREEMLGEIDRLRQAMRDATRYEEVGPVVVVKGPAIAHLLGGYRLPLDVLALLREIEWAGPDNEYGEHCVCCGGATQKGGHYPDCRLDAILRGSR